MQKIIKNPLTSLTGIALAAAAYVVSHPGDFGPIVVQVASLAQPLSAMLLGFLAKDAHGEPAK